VAVAVCVYCVVEVEQRMNILVALSFAYFLVGSVFFISMVEGESDWDDLWHFLDFVKVMLIIIAFWPVCLVYRVMNDQSD